MNPPPRPPTSSRPTSRATSEPPMPTRIVWPIPIGSGPGIARRPSAPTTRPVITSKMMNVIMRGLYPERDARHPDSPPFAAALVGAIAAGVAALTLAFAHGYGLHRDELYFMEAGHHPAWGYDDQPPLTPLIARAATAIFGATPTGLRVPSALALGACVLLAGLSARELGATRRGQVVASASLAASGALFIGHLVSTTTYDFLAWTALVYLALIIIGRDEPRLWPVFGLVLGIALLNKWLPVTLVVVLGIGLLADRRLTVIRSRWVVAAAV